MNGHPGPLMELSWDTPSSRGPWPSSLVGIILDRTRGSHEEASSSSSTPSACGFRSEKHIPFAVGEVAGAGARSRVTWARDEVKGKDYLIKTDVHRFPKHSLDNFSGCGCSVKHAHVGFVGKSPHPDNSST